MTISRAQYVRAKAKVDSILSEFGPVDSLRYKHDVYRRTKSRSLKRFFSAYRKLLSNMNKVEQYERSHNATDLCANCMRGESDQTSGIHGDNPLYSLGLATCSTLHIRSPRPFKFVKGCNSERNAKDILLCILPARTILYPMSVTMRPVTQSFLGLLSFGRSYQTSLFNMNTVYLFGNLYQSSGGIGG